MVEVEVGVGTGWHRDKLFNRQGAMATGVCIIIFFSILVAIPFTLCTGRAQFPRQECELTGDWLSGFPGGLLAV